MVYGSPYSSPYGQAKARIPQVATTSTGVGNLLDMLDVPGGYFRGLLAGRPGERVSGSELNQEYGLGDSTLGGLASEVLLDPLNLLAVGPLTKAGRAVQAAGRLGRAGEYLTSAAKAGRLTSPELAARASRAAQRAGRTLDSYSAAEIAGRPLLRPRAATRFGTARQIASGMDDATEARQLLEKAKGLEDAPLSTDFGIGLPFMRPLISGNLPGGAAARDLLDAAVVGAKFSAPFRALRAGFDSSVGGQIDEAAQVFASGAKTLADDAVARKTRQGVESAMRLRTGSQVDAFSDEGSIALGDAIEKPVGAEASAFGEDPAVKAYVDWWERESADLLEQSRQFGIKANELDDPNLGGYLPRTFNPIAEDAYAAAGLGQRPATRMTSVSSGDQLARKDFMKIPGGRAKIIELSTDPELVGKSGLPFEQRVAKIQQSLYGASSVTGETAEKSRQLANLLANIDPEKMPKGLFTENPTQAIIGYMQRRGRAVENAKNIAEYIATKAVRNSDEGSITVSEALRRGGLQATDKESTFRSVREIIAQKQGVSADSVSLTDYFVPESIGGVAGRVNEAVAAKGKPEGIKSVVSFLGRLWRNSILAFPSRYARDAVGGVYVNWLEGAASLYGYNAAQKVLRGGAVDSAGFLRQIPRYANTADDAALTVQFYADLAATGLADGMLKYDMGASPALRTTLPGIDNIAPSLGKTGRSALGTKRGIPNLLNPDSDFYNEAAAANDFVDIFNRLSGYMELLRQGVDPLEAGKRMKRAHVDYSGLTATEQAIKEYMPFYTYTSRIAQETGRKLVEQPRRLVSSLRAVEAAPELGAELFGTDGEEYIPKRYREDFAFPISQDAQGKTVVYGADLPGVDSINRLMGDRPFSSTISDVGPLAKLGVETISGRDTFTGQPLNQRRTPLGRIFGGDNELTRLADQALEVGPLYPRLSRVAADIVEPRGDESASMRGVQTALNALTGVKVRNLDNDYLRNQAIYELEDATQPFAKTYETSYIPEEILAALPPEQQRQWEALMQLREARRKAARNAR